MKEFSLIGSFSFYICCSLPVASRQQIFYSEICFFISYVPLVLKHLGIFVTVICWWNINTNISFHYRLFPRKANITKFFKKSQKPYFGPGLRRTLSLFQYLNYLPLCQKSEKPNEPFLRKLLEGHTKNQFISLISL